MEEYLFLAGELIFYLDPVRAVAYLGLFKLKASSPKDSPALIIDNF